MSGCVCKRLYPCVLACVGACMCACVRAGLSSVCVCACVRVRTSARVRARVCQEGVLVQEVDESEWPLGYDAADGGCTAAIAA
eukprot:3433752-Pleurochrysis_carterae.AAC.1